MLELSILTPAANIHAIVDQHLDGAAQRLNSTLVHFQRRLTHDQ